VGQNTAVREPTSAATNRTVQADARPLRRRMAWVAPDALRPTVTQTDRVGHETLTRLPARVIGVLVHVNPPFAVLRPAPGRTRVPTE
jgi:hypothetical protein